MTPSRLQQGREVPEAAVKALWNRLPGDAGITLEDCEFALEGDAADAIRRQERAQERARVLKEIAAAFESRKQSEAIRCSEVAAYCREQAARVEADK